MRCFFQYFVKFKKTGKRCLYRLKLRYRVPYKSGSFLGGQRRIWVLQSALVERRSFENAFLFCIFSMTACTINHCFVSFPPLLQRLLAHQSKTGILLQFYPTTEPDLKNAARILFDERYSLPKCVKNCKWWYNPQRFLQKTTGTVIEQYP